MKTLRPGTIALCLFAACGGVVAARAQSAPTRIDPSAAMRQIVKKVDPILPAAAAAANPGAPFAADIVIKADGMVESVTILVGPEALHAAAIAALKQWTFKPFVENGRPIRVVTAIEIRIPDPVRDAEKKAVNEYFDGFMACERSVNTLAPDAEAACGRVAQLSEALPADRVLERCMALEYFGMSLLQTNKPAAALAQFERAVDMRRRVSSDSDADMASLLQAVAETHARLKNFPMADDFYGMSIATFERAIVAVPSLRDNYTERLDAALRRYADLKRAMGQSSQAKALEDRAAALRLPVRGVPMPSPRSVGNVLLLGPTAPTLTDDDLRQILALVPAGKKAWLLFAQGQTSPRRLLWVDMYLAPDVSRADLQRGAVILAQAELSDDMSPNAARVWKHGEFGGSYAQVPLAGRSPVEIRGNDDRNRPILLPQTTSGDPLTDVEIVSLVAFLRQSSAKPTATRDGADPLYESVQPWPIEEVVRWESGKVDVMLRENMTLDGPGQRISLKRDGAGWTITELRPW